MNNNIDFLKQEHVCGLTGDHLPGLNCLSDEQVSCFIIKIVFIVIILAIMMNKVATLMPRSFLSCCTWTQTAFSTAAGPQSHQNSYIWKILTILTKLDAM